MRLNCFDLVEPVPELNQPHALAIIQPWTDVSNVGSLVLSRLEVYLSAKELGKLAQPGDFFDFTRYRPTLIRKENSSEVIVPNTTVTYGITHGTQPGSHDFVFLRLLEPHMQAEAYVDSVIELLRISESKDIACLVRCLIWFPTPDRYWLPAMRVIQNFKMSWPW